MRDINKNSFSAEHCVQLESETSRQGNGIKFQSNTDFLGRNLQIHSVKILPDRKLKRTNLRSPCDGMFWAAASKEFWMTTCSSLVKQDRFVLHFKKNDQKSYRTRNKLNCNSLFWHKMEQHTLYEAQWSIWLKQKLVQLSIIFFCICNPCAFGNFQTHLPPTPAMHDERLRSTVHYF